MSLSAGATAARSSSLRARLHDTVSQKSPPASPRSAVPSCLRTPPRHPQLGHMPQEDFPDALHEAMTKWLSGETDAWTTGKALKMTKYGVEES